MVFQFGIVNYNIMEMEEINSSYWILVLVPFAFLLDNKALKYVILLLTLILIIVSTKRGGTIAISLVILVSLIQGFFKRKNFLRNVLLLTSLTFIFLLIFKNTITKLNITAVDRLENTNIKEEARLELITDSWKKFKAKDLKFQIFGSGHRSTAKDRGSGYLSKTSHNDYFEILYNYGILGLTLYLYFLWQILLRIKFLYKIGDIFYEAYLVSFIIFFVMSMISHLIIYPTYYSFIIIIWALVEAKIENRRKGLPSYNMYNRNL